MNKQEEQLVEIIWLLVGAIRDLDTRIILLEKEIKG